MSAASKEQQKWQRVLSKLDTDIREDEEIEQKAKKSLSYHSLLNSVQLMKRVADEKLMEGEKSQKLSIYLEAIQLYKDILEKIQHYNSTQTEPSPPSSAPDSTGKDKLTSILFSCHLNIACGALRCQFYPEAVHHCDCAIGILTVFHGSTDLNVLSLLRAKYFKCFALLQLSEKDDGHIEFADAEMRSMRSILTSSFPPVEQEKIGKDYLELFSRIESKMQKKLTKLSEESVEESTLKSTQDVTENEESTSTSRPSSGRNQNPFKAFTESIAMESSLSSPARVKKFFPQFDDVSNLSTISVEGGASSTNSPARRSLRMKQLLSEVEDCEKRRNFSKAIQLLNDWNKLSTNPLASAKSLFYQGEFEYRQRLVRPLSEQISQSYHSSVFTYSKNMTQANNYYLASSSLLQDILPESDDSVLMTIQYQLALNHCHVAKININHLSSLDNNSESKSGDQSSDTVALEVTIVTHLTTAIDILEKLCLLLHSLAHLTDEEKEAMAITSSSLLSSSKDFIYRHLQLPPKLSLAQEILHTDVIISQVVLQLLSTYEVLSDFLRSRRHYYDCYIILKRSIQLISYIQRTVDLIESSSRPPSTNKSKGGSGMTSSPNQKRKNTSSFNLYSTNDLTALMVLLQKRQSIAFFRLGLLLRNVQIMHRLDLTLSTTSSTSSSVLTIDGFDEDSSLLYQHQSPLLPSLSSSPVSPSNSEDSEETSLVPPSLRRFRTLPSNHTRDTVLFPLTVLQAQNTTYFHLSTLTSYGESMLNCLEKAGNDCFYLLEYVMSFQSLKLCCDVLLEKYRLPSYTETVNLLDQQRDRVAVEISSEEAERVHDICKLVKKSAEKIYSNAMTSLQEKLQYLIEAVIALHQAGIVIVTASNNNHLAQRAFESAQVVQKEVQALLSQHDVTKALSTSTVVNDVSILFGDVSYYLAFVYMRSGKLTYARQELADAIANYEKTIVTSAGSSGSSSSAGSGSASGAGGDVIRRKIKNASALVAFISEVVGDKEAAEVAYRRIEDQSVGPIEDGKDEVTKLKSFIERKLPTSSPSSSLSGVTSSSPSQPIIAKERGKREKEGKEGVEKKSQTATSSSSSWWLGGWIEDSNDVIAYSILFVVVVLLISFFLPFLRDRGFL